MIPGVFPSRGSGGGYGGKRSVFQRRAQAVAFSVLMCVPFIVLATFALVMSLR